MSTAPPTPPAKPYRIEVVLFPSKKAKVKPNRYKKPGPIGNTQGIVVPRTDPGPPGGNVRPPVIPETPEEKNFLEKFKGGVDDWIDKAVEGSGYNQAAMIAGALGKAVNEVFFPTALWELIPVGKLGKIAKKGGELAGVVKKTDKAAEGTAAANKASGKGKGGRVDGGPCDHLKQGSGKGPYRGGAHSKTSKPKNDGKDSHHIPAKGANPQLDPNDGPAIQMHPNDHANTSSNGRWGKEARDYSKEISDMIKNGRIRDAMAKEIKDVRRIAREIGDSKRYNEAIQEMLEYFKCLHKNGLIG